MLIELEKVKQLARKAIIDAGGTESEHLFNNWWEKNIPVEAMVMERIADSFNLFNTVLEGKKNGQSSVEDKLYYNGQQLILLEFYQEILKTL